MNLSRFNIALASLDAFVIMINESFDAGLGPSAAVNYRWQISRLCIFYRPTLNYFLEFLDPRIKRGVII